MNKLGFGFMRLPVTDPNDATSIDLPLLTKMVDLYMERGGNYFDTAFRYCDFASEPALNTLIIISFTISMRISTPRRNNCIPLSFSSA